MAAVSDKDYSSYQDIREEAGHQHLNKLEELTGLANGANTVYYAKRTYIVDSNYNDAIDVASVSGDVIVYVNDVAVSVSAVDVTTGAITLGAAPANGATVLGTYYHSLLSDAKVDKYRKEAMSYIQRRMNGILDYESWEDTDVPAEIKTYTRMYAAGLILIRDHGLNADTELSSKDGYEKLKLVKSWLKDYLIEVGDDSDSTSPTTVSSRSDGNIFTRNNDLSTFNETVSQDEHFQRGS